MMRLLWVIVAAAAVATPGAAQMPPQPQLDSLTREVRALRKEVQTQRAELARARKEARDEADRLRMAGVDTARAQDRKLRESVNTLTAAVVLLGILACLALVLALRRRDSGTQPDVEAAKDRITRLRAQLQADEARLAEISAGKEPQAAP